LTALSEKFVADYSPAMGLSRAIHSNRSSSHPREDHWIP